MTKPARCSKLWKRFPFLNIWTTEKQLAIWQQRVESTPTELDQMLTDYGSQTTALEETIRTLRADLENRDEKISTLETRVKEVEESENELSEDRDRVQDEMRALSEAYGSLEDEYRRLEEQQQQQQHLHPPEQAPTEEPTTAAGEDPSGAEGGEETSTRAAEQSQGESPDQLASVAAAGSTEVATLRAENTRLRETARQADDWMRMAVERMNTQDTQLTQTQQRIHELEAQLGQGAGEAQTSSAFAAEHDEFQRREHDLRQALEQEQIARGEIEQQLSGVSQELTLRFEQEEGARADLERALEQARNQVVVLKQEVSLMQSQNDEMAREDTKTFDALVSQKQAAQQVADAELSSAKEAASKLQAEKEALERRIQVLENNLQAYQQGSSSSNELDSLSQELALSRADLESSQLKFAAEMARKDAAIRSLESQLSGLQAEAASEDIRARDEEIEQLRQSNQAAQEWMAQAVQHHNALSEQNATLASEIKALKEHSLLPSSGDAASAEVRTKLDAMSKSLGEVQSQLQERDERISTLVAECDKLQNLKGPLAPLVPDAECTAELTTLREEIERLRQEKAEDTRRLEAAELEYEQMKSELAILSHEYEDLQEELATLQQGASAEIPQQELGSTGKFI